MARLLRQSKLIEIISKKEIETQEELVSSLCNAGFNVTQATVSRDIKELGLIKITGEKKKYKYAFVGGEEKVASNKISAVFKEAVVWVKHTGNLVVVKTVRGTAQAISNLVDRLTIEHVMGCVYGDDTVMLVIDDIDYVQKISARLNDILTK